VWRSRETSQSGSNLFTDIGYIEFHSSVFSNTESGFNPKLSVYPNPFNDVISINIDSNAKVEIYDLLGKIIYIKDISLGTTQLDLGNSANGMYLVKVINEKKTIENG
jgi:hypothetical protein